MQVHHYLIVIKRRFWLIFLGMIICAGATAAITSIRHPIFEATATIQVADPGTDIFGNQAEAVTYALQVTNADVLTAAVSKLPGETLAHLQNEVSAFPIDNTQLIAVQADASTPQESVVIANTVAQVFIQQKLVSETVRLQAMAKQLATQLATAKTNMDQAEQHLTQLQQSNASAAQIQQANDQLATYQSTYDALSASYDAIQAQETQVNSSLILDQLATLPTGPTGMGKGLAIGIAAALSLLLMLALVLLLDWLDATIKTPEDVTQLARLEPLGSIPAQRDGLAAFPTRASEMHDDIVEQAFTVISTNFQALYRGQRTLLVAGLHRKNGATTTAALLAQALAQSGVRVLLVDANLREPVLHEVFHVVNNRGLANSPGDVSLLRKQPSEIYSWLQTWTTQVPNLWLLPAGPASTSPTSILRSPELQKLIRWLLQESGEEAGTAQKLVDIIIFDAPALLEEADATVLAYLCDSALLVVEAARERKETLEKASNMLQRLGAPVLGVVVNRQKASHQSYLYNNHPAQPEMWLEERSATEPPAKYPPLRFSAQQLDGAPLRIQEETEQSGLLPTLSRERSRTNSAVSPNPIPSRPFSIKRSEEQGRR